MKIVIFGLTVSSSWGNGHATLWRGLIRSLSRRGHDVVFFERDVPYYALHRDIGALPGAELVLYPEWVAVRETACAQIAESDVAVVTSYCPDALAAIELLRADAHTLRACSPVSGPGTSHTPPTCRPCEATSTAPE